ncbi:MAG TPA: glycosyltransferase [Armatimonadota bacterium]
MHILAVTNMYPTPEDPTSGTFVEQQVMGLRRVGVTVEVMLARRLREGAGVYRRLGERVEERVRQGGVDLVHVMYGGVMADQVTRRLRGVPMVVSFCGSDLLGEPLNGALRKLIGGYGVLCSHRAARRAQGIVVKSRNLQQALPRSADRERSLILPNGIDLDRFQEMDRAACRAKLGWCQDSFSVLFPTNAGDARKRLWLAQGAVDLLKAAGLPVELRQLKGVPHAEVPLWLNASDAVILTSQHEGSPNVVKEALACNVPVVSVDVGDVRERLEGIEGCYLAEANPPDLAAKLRRVHGGPGRVLGRERVLELSVERAAARLREHYDRILAREAAHVG